MNFFKSFRKSVLTNNVNVITLNFFDKNIEKKFRKEYFNKSLFAFRVSFITVMLLYSAFGYLDYTTSEEFYKSFFVIRYLIVLPILLGVFLFSFSKYFIKIWQLLLSICYVIAGAGIILMLLKDPDNIFYYGGIFLIFAAGYFFIKLRFLAALIPGILIIILYNIGSFLFQSVDDLNYEYLLLTNAFYISANIISLIALYSIELLERKDFYQRSLLIEAKNEINLINKSLEAKVNERTKLLNERNTNLIDEISNRKSIENKLLIAINKAEESDRLKSAFLANMSHEIRTPMNGILGFTDLLKEADLSGKERKRYIGVIEKSGERMLSTINDIIDFSRIESGEVLTTIKPTNINAQLESLYDFFKPQAEKKNIKLSFKPGFDNISADILTDPEKFDAIFTNLIKNAIKYTPEGFIEFGYTLIDKKIHFYTKDSGKGINLNQQESIFDRFVQEDDSNTNAHQGSGLGLSIVKAYVELLEGKVWVESVKGKGSTFNFTIPYNPIKSDLSASETDDKETRDQKSSFANKTILVVEDDETSYEYLEVILKSFGISNLLWAENGEESIKLCKKNPAIDLVLMDINLPVMNGYDATKAIKANRPDLPIIAQTAYALAGDREKSLEAGCDDYITKPIKKEELLEKMENFLG